MNELTVISFGGIEVTDSRQVAELIGKEHYELLKDIRRYVKYLNEVKIPVVDFFLESTYIDGKGEERPCYLVTRKGCEMIANKLTGKKGTAFTALYINAFHNMEQQLNTVVSIEQDLPPTSNDIDIKLINAKVKLSNQFLKLSKLPTLSPERQNDLLEKAIQVLDETALPEPKMYSATEIGELLGCSAQKIGLISNKHNLKTSEYGMWFRDKSRYSDKEVQTFKYNEKAVAKFRELLK